MSNSKDENIFLTELQLKNKFKKKSEEYKKIIEKYFIKYHDKDNKENVKTTLYSIGGEMIHRGYFCPSPIIDLYINNVRRGKIINKKDKVIDYKYQFDENNNICKCLTFYKKSEPYSEEFIWYENNIQYGICIKKNSISYVSKCIYERNKIIKYEKASGFFNSKYPQLIEIEEYFYNDKYELASSLEYKYFIYKDELKLTNRYLYNFIKNEKNNVTGYNIQVIYDGKVIDSGMVNISKSKQRNIEKFTGQPLK